MSQKLGETKVVILESCITPKSWTDLVKETGKTEPTLMVHLNDLQDKNLITKTEQGFYQTTDSGIEIVSLNPNMRAPPPANRVAIEAINIINSGLGKDYDLTEKLAAQFPVLVLKGYAKKNLGAFVNAIAEAVRSSVIMWVPAKEVELDRKLFQEINHLVAKVMKKKAVIAEGKVRIIIDVDFPKALDMRIRNEKDPDVKQTLIENRQRIIEDVVANWSNLFVRH
jgi:hypothetical protein